MVLVLIETNLHTTKMWHSTLTQVLGSSPATFSGLFSESWVGGGVAETRIPLWCGMLVFQAAAYNPLDLFENFLQKELCAIEFRFSLRKGDEKKIEVKSVLSLPSTGRHHPPLLSSLLLCPHTNGIAAQITTAPRKEATQHIALGQFSLSVFSNVSETSTTIRH